MSWSVEQKEGVSIIRMQSGKANAMNPDFFRELSARLTELETNPGPLVLTAEGEIFCAGLDLPGLGVMNRPELEVFFQQMDDALLQLFRFPGPTVAAINGHAIAGGAVLAHACDTRIMARGKARIGLSEVAVGVSFPSVPFELVRGGIAPRYAREILQFGTLYGPEEAANRGLVDEVVAASDLVEIARARAGRLATDSLQAHAIIKRQVNRVVLERIAANKKEDDRAFFDNWFSPACQRRIAATIAGFKKS